MTKREAQRQAREESRIRDWTIPGVWRPQGYKTQRRTGSEGSRMWEDLEIFPRATRGGSAPHRHAQRALREWRERRVAELTCEAKP